MGVEKKRLILLFVVVVLVTVMVRPIEVSAVDEWLDNNAFDSTFTEWDNNQGSNWLYSQEGSNYCWELSSDSMQIGWFDFPSTTETGVLEVVISGYVKNADGAANDHIEVFLDYVAGGGISVGDFACTTTWAYVEIVLTGTYTVAEVNAMRIYLDTDMVGQGDDVYIDHLRIGVTVAGGTLYYAYPSGSFALGGTTNLAASFSKTLIEGFSLAGTVALIAAFSKTLSEGFALTGIISVSVIIQKLIFDSFSFTGITSLIAAFSKTLSEGFTLTGITSLVAAFSKTLIEGFSLTGIVSTFKVIILTIQDSFSLTGVVALAGAFLTTLVESFGLTGVVALAGSYVSTLVEGFSLTGIVSAFKVIILTIQDGFVFVGLIVLDIEQITRTLIYEIFFSLEMWGYLGPVALVIIGYIVTKKDKSLGIFMFIVECLVIAQYLTLVEATPNYWWQIIILLLGVILCAIQLGGDKL